MRRPGGQQDHCAVPLSREDINHALGLDLQSHVGMDMPSYLIQKIAENVGSAFFEMDGWQVIADVTTEVAQEYLSNVIVQLAREENKGGGENMEPRELERLLKLASESVQELLESLPDLWTIWPKVPDRHVVRWYNQAVSLLEGSVTALSVAAMCVERCVGPAVTLETEEGPVGPSVTAEVVNK